MFLHIEDYSHCETKFGMENVISDKEHTIIKYYIMVCFIFSQQQPYQITSVL